MKYYKCNIYIICNINIPANNTSKTPYSIIYSRLLASFRLLCSRIISVYVFADHLRLEAKYIFLPSHSFVVRIKFSYPDGIYNNDSYLTGDDRKI